MLPQDLKIAVIGAGIGGLTAALAMRQRGFEPVVFEQASELGEVGAGLTIGARPGQVLEALGLRSQLDAMADPTPHLGTLHSHTGERLSYECRDNLAYRERYGSVTRQVHRADLHAALVNALPEASIHTAHELDGIRETGKRVSLEFVNDYRAEFDLVIASDGLKSTVRRQLFSAQDAFFTGFVAWRGLVPRVTVPQVSLDPYFASYTAADRMFARYPLRRGQLVNYVAIARRPDFTQESWHTRAPVSDVLEQFDGWHSDVVDLIAATPSQQCMCWALYTRQPLDRYVSRRVALLGDAAHPMTPFYGMGAAMAIEDGYILARCLEAGTTITEALARYEKARRPRANHMQEISLQRADAYMGNNEARRSQAPGAGLENMMAYDPITVSV